MSEQRPSKLSSEILKLIDFLNSEESKDLYGEESENPETKMLNEADVDTSKGVSDE